MLFRLFKITSKANLSLRLLLFFSILSSLIEFLALSSVITLLILFFKKDFFIIEKLNFLSKFEIVLENYFLSISLLSFLFFSLFTVLYVLIKYFIRDKTNNFQEQLSCKIFSNFINENILSSKKKDTSNVFNAISSEISRFINVVYAYLEIVSKLFLIFIIGILLFIFNFKITFSITILLIIFYSIYFLLFKNFINKFNIDFSLLNRNNVNFIRRGLESLIEFKIFNLMKNFILEFEKNLKILNKLRLKNEVIQIIPKYLLEILVLAIIIFFLNLFNDQKQNILEVLAVYMACFYKLYPAVNNVFSNFVIFRSNTNSINKINEYLENERGDIISSNNSEIDLKIINSINLRNISFKYSEAQKYILDNLNLNIKKSDKVVILGKTGSGKTTLLQILMGIITTAQGTVKINSLNLNEKSVPAWLSKITYAPQNPYLFNDSIVANITFKTFDHLKDFEKKRFNQVIKDCLIDEFYNLDDIISKKIGEHGSKLSAGQKQRVNLARALFKVSDVIFLDEPTSNLDENTEKILLENIYRRYIDRILIVSTHRKEALNYSNLTVNL